MSNELTIREDAVLVPQTFEGLMKQAEVLVKSGLLPKTIKTPAAAVAVMLTGRELGLPSMQSFRSIYVVEGQPSLSTELMAAMILEAGITYNVDELTNTACQITWKRPNGMTHTHRWTAEDAKAAGLLGRRNWQAYPRDMLYNRCFSAGARKIAPDVLGKMYTPEELAPDAVSFNGETFEIMNKADDVIDAEYEEQAEAEATEQPQKRQHQAATDVSFYEVEEKTEQMNKPSLAKQKRPWDPAHLKAVIYKSVNDKLFEPESDRLAGLRGVTVAALDGLFSHDSKEAATTQRHQLTDALIGKPSAKEFNTAECRTLLGWAQEEVDGAKIPSGLAVQEAAKVIVAVGLAAGQQALEMADDEVEEPLRF